MRTAVKRYKSVLVFSRSNRISTILEVVNVIRLDMYLRFKHDTSGGSRISRAEGSGGGGQL